MSIHPIQRAKERYNLDLTIEDLVIARKKILNGHSKFLGLRKGKEWYEMTLKGQRVHLIFDPINNMVITFKPLDSTPFRYQLEQAEEIQSDFEPVHWFNIDTIRGPWFSLGFHIDFQRWYIDIHFIWWIITIGRGYGNASDVVEYRCGYCDGVLDSYEVDRCPYCKKGLGQ